MYNSRVKNRKIKKLAWNFANMMKFKTTNFSSAAKTTFVWVIVWMISLSINWISENQAINTWAFNKITWINALFILICLFLSAFIIFSTNKKERLKMFLNISFKDTPILKKLWWLIIILSVSSLYSIVWLSTFSSEIEYSSWIILSISSWIIIFYSWYITKKQELDNTRLYFQDTDDGSITKEKEDNMKLPF